MTGGLADQIAMHLQPAARGDEGGFGMAVLEGAARVSVHLHPGGKTVRAAIPDPLENRGHEGARRRYRWIAGSLLQSLSRWALCRCSLG